MLMFNYFLLRIVTSTLNVLTLIHRVYQSEVMILMLFLKTVLKMLPIMYPVGKKYIAMYTFVHAIVDILVSH